MTMAPPVTSLVLHTNWGLDVWMARLLGFYGVLRSTFAGNAAKQGVRLPYVVVTK